MTDITSSGLLGQSSIATPLLSWRDYFVQSRPNGAGGRFEKALAHLDDCQAHCDSLRVTNSPEIWTHQWRIRVELTSALEQMLAEYERAAVGLPREELAPDDLIAETRTVARGVSDVSSALKSIDTQQLKSHVSSLWTSIDAQVRSGREQKHKDPRLRLLRLETSTYTGAILEAWYQAPESALQLSALVDLAFLIRASLQNPLPAMKGKKRFADIRADCLLTLKWVDSLLRALDVWADDDIEAEEPSEEGEPDDESVVENSRVNLSVDSIVRPDESFELKPLELDLDSIPNDPRALLKAACARAEALCSSITVFVEVLDEEDQRKFSGHQGLARTAQEGPFLSSIPDSDLKKIYADLLRQFGSVYVPLLAQLRWTKREARDKIECRKAWVAEAGKRLTSFVTRIRPVIKATGEVDRLLKRTAASLSVEGPDFVFNVRAASRYIEDVERWLADLRSEVASVQRENDQQLAEKQDQATAYGKLYLNPHALVISGELISDVIGPSEEVHDLEFVLRRGGKSISPLKMAGRFAGRLAHGQRYRGDIVIRNCPAEGEEFARLALAEITDKLLRFET